METKSVHLREELQKATLTFPVRGITSFRFRAKVARGLMRLAARVMWMRGEVSEPIVAGYGIQGK
jgi:hypothetical protein